MRTRRASGSLILPLLQYGYGPWSYGFERGGRRHRVAKRPGSIMGANTVLYRLLDQNATIILLANTNRPSWTISPSASPTCWCGETGSGKDCSHAEHQSIRETSRTFSDALMLCVPFLSPELKSISRML